MSSNCSILCIGGSTHNEGTPKMIQDALKKSGLLEKNWAVIFANHDYLSIDKKDYEARKTKIISLDFQGLNTILINPPNKVTDSANIYPISQSNIYIIPDSIGMKPVSKISIDYSNRHSFWSIVIEWADKKYHDQIFEKFKKSDGVACLPDIDDIMSQITNNYQQTNKTEKIAGIIVAGRGDDGSKGLLKIKQAGGKTAVQNPDECVHRSVLNDEMPKNALSLAQRSEKNHDLISLYDNSQNIPTLVDWLSKLL